jgi:putative ABC transport system permease protein
MTGSGRRPPRLAERLLAAARGRGEWTESVLGDLHEEYTAHASRSRLHAATWYWLQVIRLAARGLGAHLRRAPRLPTYISPDVYSQPAGDSLMRTLGLEMRYAGRSILKRPAMSAIVVITLGLGLGANAAVFSMIDALVLRPFTMRDSDRMTLVSYTRPESQNRREGLSPADYLDLKKQADVFERFAAFEW